MSEFMKRGIAKGGTPLPPPPSSEPKGEREEILPMG